MNLKPVVDVSANQIGKIIRNDARLLSEGTGYVSLREDLRKLVCNEITRFHKGQPTGNLLLFGQGGVGKTSLLERVARSFPEGGNLKIVHVNCWRYSAPLDVYSIIAKALGERVPERGFSSRYALEKLVESMKRSGTKVVLVLDEIDGLLFNKGKKLLFDLTEPSYAQFFRFIGVCDDSKGFTQLENRIIRRLRLAQLEVKPFTESELTQILAFKASTALIDGVYSRSVIAACVQRANGSAWEACDALWNAALRAERHDRNEILLEDIEETEIDGISVTPVVKANENIPAGLSKEEHLILSILSTGSANSTRVYREFGRKAARTKRQIRNYLKHLTSIGVIRATEQPDSPLRLKPRVFTISN